MAKEGGNEALDGITMRYGTQEPTSLYWTTA